MEQATRVEAQVASTFCSVLARKVREHEAALSDGGRTGCAVRQPVRCLGPAGPIGYPPPLIGTSCSFTESIGVGSAISISVNCTFEPRSTITITLNGAAYGAATAPATGTFVETFTATPGPSVSFDGDPVVVTTYGAVNTFVPSGTNPGAGTNVAMTLVTITPAVVSTPATATPGTGTATATASATPVTSSGLALPGPTLWRW